MVAGDRVHLVRNREAVMIGKLFLLWDCYVLNRGVLLMRAGRVVGSFGLSYLQPCSSLVNECV